jgi:RES domain-containing protein
MLQGARLDAAIANLKLIAVHGPWTRVIAFRYMIRPAGVEAIPQPLWSGGPALNGARFTPKRTFDSLYLASDPVTSLVEVESLVSLSAGFIAVRTQPLVLVSVDGIVSNIVDLTDGRTLDALGTNIQEVTGAWARTPHPPTQSLGRAAYASGRIAGIKYRSAKNPSGQNFVVFPDRLPAVMTDFLEVFDPDGNLSQRMGV